VRRAGEAAGLTTLSQVSQAELLAGLGIGEALSNRPAAEDLEAYYSLRKAVMELTDAAGLGRITALLMGTELQRGG
jgi:SAM-dependent MidA family methyltransferase